MIHRIFSSLPSFKNLSFHEGLNIVVAEKSEGASEKQTRNRAGKSSLVEIIHFLTGGKVEKTSIFYAEPIKTESFGIEFDLGGSKVAAERSASQPTRVYVDGTFDAWPIAPALDRNSGRLFVSNSDWQRILAKLLFGLNDGSDDAEDDGRFGPSLRSLFSYFVRRESAGGFKGPTRQNDKQLPADMQVNLSFLLGLDWRIPQQWQLVRQREQTVKTLKKLLKDGEFGALLPSAADLRSQLAVVEEKVLALRGQLKAFQVLPEYHELEQEATGLTSRLNEFANQNAIDEEIIGELGRAVASEKAPRETQLERVYAEAGVALPESALRRFEDVQAFHRSVVSNRRSYLEGELASATSRCDERRRQMEGLDRRRSEVMTILQSHGALEQFSVLQGEFARREGELEDLRRRFETTEELETRKAKLDIERKQLRLRLQQDYHEQSSALKDAIVAFEGISGALYEKSGRLKIEVTENGPSFDVSIHGGKSKGISNMQILCFDMMLMRICSGRRIGPGFLVHDSHLFDGVDDRQAASALEIGRRQAEELGSQYLVTFNSDVFAQVAELKPDLKRAVLPTKLSDASEDGGLFGIRFG